MFDTFYRIRAGTPNKAGECEDLVNGGKKWWGQSGWSPRSAARPAVSAERVAYDKAGGTVTVRSSKKVHGVRPVVAQYDALNFLSLLALQVPPPEVHMVRYYGHYSVRSRAERRKRAGDGPPGWDE